MALGLSTFNIEAENTELVPCPFDKAHQIRRARMIYHIVKCQRQHPDVILEKCPYDTSHMLRASEMEKHKATCEGRARMEEYSRIFHEDQPHDLKVAMKDHVVPEPPTDEGETWDGLVGNGGYNAQKAIKDKKIIRIVRGKTKAERRRFYALEHQRHIALMNRHVVQEDPDLEAHEALAQLSLN